MTERKRAANLGRETPTIIKQSDSGPAGITEALDNHLEKKLKRSSVIVHEGFHVFWVESWLFSSSFTRI
jgi:hypothetical protein